jgi:hypothetical protein
MFKIIYRIIIILLVAGLVSGGIYLFFNTSAGQALIQNGRSGGFEREARFAPGGNALTSNFSDGAAFQPGPRGGFGSDGDFHGAGGSPLALIDLVKNAGIIGLITIAVVLVQKTWAAIRRQILRRSLKPAAS